MHHGNAATVAAVTVSAMFAITCDNCVILFSICNIITISKRTNRAWKHFWNVTGTFESRSNTASEWSARISPLDCFSFKLSVLWNFCFLHHHKSMFDAVLYGFKLNIVYVIDQNKGYNINYWSCSNSKWIDTKLYKEDTRTYGMLYWIEFQEEWCWSSFWWYWWTRSSRKKRIGSTCKCDVWL